MTFDKPSLACTTPRNKAMGGHLQRARDEVQATLLTQVDAAVWPSSKEEQAIPVHQKGSYEGVRRQSILGRDFRSH